MVPWLFRLGGRHLHRKRDLPVMPPDLPILLETSPRTNGMLKNLLRPDRAGKSFPISAFQSK